MLHLETGYCDSRVRASDIDVWVSRTFYSYDFRHGQDEYECPDCRKVFRYFSGFLQHTENSSCDVDSYRHDLDHVLEDLQALVSPHRMESDDEYSYGRDYFGL